MILLKLLTKFYLFIISFSYLMIFIWFKFIRERVPKDIPFNLTIIGSLLLIIICVFSIKKCFEFFVIPKNIHLNITQLLYIPLQYLDKCLKKDNLLSEKYNQIIIKFIPLLKKYNHYLFILQLVYQVILLLSFIIDVFNGRLDYFYKSLYFIFILYICNYIIYCLREIKTEKILLIDQRMEIQINNCGLTYDIETFFIDQTLNKINNKSLFPYIVTMKLDYIRKLNKELNVPEGFSIDASSYATKVRKNINTIIKISEILYLYDTFYRKYNILFLIISLIHAIFWFYILIVSLPSLHVSFFEFDLFIKFKFVYEDSWNFFPNIYEKDDLIYMLKIKYLKTDNILK